jgi:hypothetical protein
MLQAAGFRTEPVRQMRHSDWLRSSAKLAIRQGTVGLAARLLMWKLPAKLVAWMCYIAGDSDCILCVAERPA